MKKISVGLAVILVLASGLLGNGLNLNGLGARAASMGGAFVGLANDFTAVFWNPAGLALLTNRTFGLTGNLLAPKSKYFLNSSFDMKTKNEYYPAGLIGYFQPIGGRGGRRAGRLHPVRPRRGLEQHRVRNGPGLSHSSDFFHPSFGELCLAEFYRLHHPGPVGRGQDRRRDLLRSDLQYQLRLLPNRSMGNLRGPADEAADARQHGPAKSGHQGLGLRRDVRLPDQAERSDELQAHLSDTVEIETARDDGVR